MTIKQLKRALNAFDSNEELYAMTLQGEFTGEDEVMRVVGIKETTSQNGKDGVGVLVDMENAFDKITLSKILKSKIQEVE